MSAVLHCFVIGRKALLIGTVTEIEQDQKVQATIETESICMYSASCGISNTAMVSHLWNEREESRSM